MPSLRGAARAMGLARTRDPIWGHGHVQHGTWALKPLTVESGSGAYGGMTKKGKAAVGVGVAGTAGAGYGAGRKSKVKKGGDVAMPQISKGVVTGMNMARAAGPGAVQAGKRVGKPGVEGLFKPVGGKRKAGLQTYAGRHVGKRDTLSAFGIDHGGT